MSRSYCGKISKYLGNTNNGVCSNLGKKLKVTLISVFGVIVRMHAINEVELHYRSGSTGSNKRYNEPVSDFGRRKSVTNEITTTSFGSSRNR